MALTVLAHSPDCEGGNCPTIWQDPTTRVVQIRGTDPADPARELDIQMSGDAWNYLLAQLPR